MPFDPDHVFVIRLRPSRPFTREVIEAHVAHLRRLDDDGRLVLAGPMTDGSGGLVVVRARDQVDARRLADADPFVARGFETYELHPLRVSRRGNNYLLDG